MLTSQVIWVFAMAMVNTAAALPKLSDVERRSTLGTPKVAGWVSSWGGTKHVDLYDMYDEISFLPAVVNEKFEAVWSIDGDVTKSIPKEKMMSPQRPTLLSIGGWSGSGNVSYLQSH